MININLYSDFKLITGSLIKKCKKLILNKFFSEEYNEILLNSKEQFLRTNKKVSFAIQTLPIGDKVPTKTNIDIKLLSHKNKEVLIILQGPITEYTLETVNIYKKIFPEAGISIGSWKDSNKKYVADLIRKVNFLGLSEKPKYSGFMNINFQLKSTKNGFNKSLIKNYKFVLKQRSDQRIYRLDALTYLSLKIEKEPNKVIILSNGTSSKVKYHIGDHLTFSSITKFQDYWIKTPLKKKKDDLDSKPIIKYSLKYRNGKKIYPEQWLGGFYKELIYKNKDISQIQFLLNCFIVINPISIRLHFNKYNTFLSEIQINEIALKNPHEYVFDKDPKLDAIEYEILKLAAENE